MKVKKERVPKSENETCEGKVDHNKAKVKVEIDNLGNDSGYGLPSPASSPTTSLGGGGAGSSGTVSATMPQHKRKLVARDDHFVQQVKEEDEPASKKMKKQA